MVYFRERRMTKRRTAQDAGTPRLAVGYVRVSTKGQKEEGLSLETQRERINAWATLNGRELRAIKEDARSGKNADRPGLLEALEIVCANRGALVVCKLDRFSRSTKDAIEIAARLADAGADLVSLSEHIDTTHAMGRFVYRLFASLNELERERIGERTREVLDGKRRRGEALGNAPYGYLASGRGVDGGASLLLPDPKEQGVLVTMRTLWGTLRSYAGVARTLNERGMLSRSGTPWSTGQVRRILLAGSLHSDSTEETTAPAAV